MSEALAGSPGPHVFVDSLDVLQVAAGDLDHLAKSLRMRDGDPLTVSDGAGRWQHAEFSSDGSLKPAGEIVTVAEPSPDSQSTVAFSLTKSSKPEWVIQKLTELGVLNIVVLRSERTIVKWDDSKIDKATSRWKRIVREAAMQSHQVRLPTVIGVVPAIEWLARPDVAIAHFGGEVLTPLVRSIAIGPEGGWSDDEVDAASMAISLGTSVLRAETAAVAAGVRLTL